VNLENIFVMREKALERHAGESEGEED